ncbi:MAG: transglycosylase SLT domain-containing protein [SAR324 cluster bacterium]|uniref:Transglycosylase SLT domain-containing protein n=1 Tax=SAR324 cluster bacterium TaxID=2024889 RepID=A0A7X9FTI1_9DELT|nr:transglycosylase SLT domain-containing protein [SAR324 cluster bacterium]
MKINFSGTYEQTRKLITAPAQKAEKSPEDFSKLLGSISPKEQQHAKITTEKSLMTRQTLPSQRQIHEAMARYNAPEPELKYPESIAGPVKLEAPVDVNNSPESVKTSEGLQPKILKARRISSKEADRLESLSLNERMAEVKSIVAKAGKKHAVDPALGMAVVANESSFDPYAISSDGFNSKGLFQLLDTTGKDMIERLDVRARYNPFNPHMNVELGIGYLRYLHDIFNTETELPNKMRTQIAANSSSLEKLAVAAFNAGEGRVASAQARAKRAGKDPGIYENIKSYLPEITQQYVDRVMASRGAFEGRFID